MPIEHLDVTDRTGLDFGRERDPHDALGDDLRDEHAGQFQRGQLVRHPTFGLGRIAIISDMGQHTRAVIDFNEVGRKTLILQYARLEAVG